MNLEDHLLGLSEPVETEYACPDCGRRGPPFIMAITDPETGAFTCSTCHTDAARAAADGPLELVWEDIKAERNLRINDVTWAIGPASPLTVECQADFIAYVAALHRVTVDYASPVEVVWPTKPELAYPA